MLSVTNNTIMLNVVMLNVVMLSVIMLNVIMLNVMAPIIDRETGVPNFTPIQPLIMQPWSN